MRMKTTRNRNFYICYMFLMNSNLLLPFNWNLETLGKPSDSLTTEQEWNIYPRINAGTISIECSNHNRYLLVF